jgi:hypothetical protein
VYSRLSSVDLIVAASQQLFLQTAGRIPALGLQQVVALMAGDFAVQVVALVADQFVFIEAQCRADDRCRKSAN